MKTFNFKLSTGKIYHIVISGILSVLLVACDLEELLQNEEDEFIITQEQAMIAAANLLFPEPEQIIGEIQVLKEEDFIISKDISSIRAIYADQAEPVFYIVNYNPSGFVIISGDRRIKPVLAYSEQNNFLFEDEFYPPGLVDLLNGYASLVIRIRNKEIELNIEESLLYWSNLLAFNINILFLNIRTCFIDEEDYIERKVLLETRWNQGCGYNDWLADSCNNFFCNRPPVGCVATAMAQILKYHADNGWDGNYILANGTDSPFINWENMPLTGVNVNNNGHIPLLMLHLGQMLDMIYSCDGSGAYSSDAQTSFINNFSFSNATLKVINSASDYNVVFADIFNDLPVYMSGRKEVTELLENDEIRIRYPGHAWVADGYSQLYRCGEGFIDNQFELHMNWGWGGFGDGYYVKKEGLFELRRNVIHNIALTD